MIIKIDVVRFIDIHNTRDKIKIESPMEWLQGYPSDPGQPQDPDPTPDSYRAKALWPAMSDVTRHWKEKTAGTLRFYKDMMGI